MALQGTFDVLDFTEVLRLLARHQLTGRLHVRHRSFGANLFIESGQLTGADQSEHQPAAASGDVRGRIEEICFEMLEAERGSFEFQPGKPGALPVTTRYRVDTVLGQARKRLDQWRGLQELIPSLELQPRLVGDLVQAEVTIDQERWRMLTAIDGRRNLRAIGRILNVSDFDVCRVLAGLMNDGVVELDGLASLPAASRDAMPTVVGPEPSDRTRPEPGSRQTVGIRTSGIRTTPSSPLPSADGAPASGAPAPVSGKAAPASASSPAPTNGTTKPKATGTGTGTNGKVSNGRTAADVGAGTARGGAPAKPTTGSRRFGKGRSKDGHEPTDADGQGPSDGEPAAPHGDSEAGSDDPRDGAGDRTATITATTTDTTTVAPAADAMSETDENAHVDGPGGTDDHDGAEDIVAMVFGTATGATPAMAAGGAPQRDGVRPVGDTDETEATVGDGGPKRGRLVRIRTRNAKPEPGGDAPQAGRATPRASAASDRRRR